jgi:hypothetical protein
VTRLEKCRANVLAGPPYTDRFRGPSPLRVVTG